MCLNDRLSIRRWVPSASRPFIWEDDRPSPLPWQEIWCCGTFTRGPTPEPPNSFRYSQTESQYCVCVTGTPNQKHTIPSAFTPLSRFAFSMQLGCDRRPTGTDHVLRPELQTPSALQRFQSGPHRLSFFLEGDQFRCQCGETRRPDESRFISYQVRVISCS